MAHRYDISLDMAAEMLEYIDGADRDIRVKIAFSLQAAIGEDAFQLWADWSGKWSRANIPELYGMWKSCSRAGSVGPGTMIHLAKQGGFKSDRAPAPRALTPQEKTSAIQARERDEALRRRRAEQCKRNTNKIIRACRREPFEYLANKGFPEQNALVIGPDALNSIQKFTEPFDEEVMIVPMRNPAKQFTTAQIISADGSKQFMPGGNPVGTKYTLGDRFGGISFFCEGLATGLSVLHALKEIHVARPKVVVLFTSHNLSVVGKKEAGFVIADNDAGTNRRRGFNPGIEAALKTGKRFWHPPDDGSGRNIDANDFMQDRGIEALAKELQVFLGRDKPAIHPSNRKGLTGESESVSV